MVKEKFEDRLSLRDKSLLETGPMFPKPWDFDDPLMMKKIACSQRDYHNLIQSEQSFYDAQAKEEEADRKYEFEASLKEQKEEEQEAIREFFRQRSTTSFPIINNSKEDFDED